MPIAYDSKDGTLTLQASAFTYQMKIGAYGYLIHTYAGQSAEGDFSSLIGLHNRGFSGNPPEAGRDRTFSIDAVPLEYPAESTGDFRPTAFGVRDERGISDADLRYVSHSISKGKYKLEGLPSFEDEDAETLSVILEDKVRCLKVELLYSVIERFDLITRAVRITNESQNTLILENAASACLDFLSGDWDLIHFWGRHGAERTPERTPISHNGISIGSRRGTSSHQHNPYVILADKNTNEDSGLCFGLYLVWSGSFSFRAEKDAIERTRVIIGLQDERFGYPLLPGESLTTPEAALFFSDSGFSGLSLKEHDAIRENLIGKERSFKPRPVLINSWEAAYFNFNRKSLLDFAASATKCGIKLFVLDDGWFRGRSNDMGGLGDWIPDEEKLGGTLKELATDIKKLGMDFGLWIEPEAINDDSALFALHPDWILKTPGRIPTPCRNQYVLDFSRAEVVDEVYKKISKVISSAPISYVKYDMNRSIANVATHTEGLQSQGMVLYRYMMGVYRFFSMLRRDFPSLLIESCSGGGGRFDLGMLYYTPQIWLSDDTDPIERIAIELGSSYGYPMSTMGAHVSASPNHMTGRCTDYILREIVAEAGILGYELDPTKLTEDQIEYTCRAIKEYEKTQDLILRGDFYRLTDIINDRDTAAWMTVSKDKTLASVSIVTLSQHAKAPDRIVRLKGLEENSRYILSDGSEHTGSFLMHGGILVPWEKGEYRAYRLFLQKGEQSAIQRR